MVKIVKGRNQLLQWLSDLLAFFQTDAIKIPTDYRTQVLEIHKTMRSDVSGLVNSLLDFKIKCAQVDYRIETGNETLNNILNQWLRRLNSGLRGKVPTGLNPFAKEYFRERWKASSFLLLRTFWEDVPELEGLNLPTQMFFVDGEDIRIDNDLKAPISLGDEKYSIRISDNHEEDVSLPDGTDEVVFVQKPYESWGTRYPIPYLIRRGIYRNMKFLEMMATKGEHIVGRALEYLMVIKKGSERLAIEGRPEFTYDENDLKNVSQDLKELFTRLKNEQGASTYTTNFDTDITHLIPDYDKAIKEGLYSPIEKRILFGLGMTEVVDTASTTRRESILNPKPFIADVNQGVDDFEALLTDIVYTIIDRNKKKHPKWMALDIKVKSSPVKEFIDNNMRVMLRSLFDRGSLSKRTFVEVVGELDYDIEVERRQKELDSGEDIVMFAPVIQNLAQFANPIPSGKNPQTAIAANAANKPIAPASPKGAVQKKSFKGSILTQRATCQKCDYEGLLVDFVDNMAIADDEEHSMSCPGCGEELETSDLAIWDNEQPIPEGASTDDQEVIDTYLDMGSVFDEVSYKNNTELPKTIQILPTAARSIWRKVFNEAYTKDKNELSAIKIAWNTVKNTYKKVNDKWVKASKEAKKAEIVLEESAKKLDVQIKEKKSKLLDKLLKEDNT